jgi:hypothetical protein
MAHAQSGDPHQVAMINVAEPADFSDLTGPQQAVVDVYFGGRKIGESEIVFRPGAITFSDPAKIVAMLPDLSEPSAVLAALSAPNLASNSGLACTQGADTAVCGRLAPDVAGVIFDQDRFRVDLFVNPRFLAVKEAVASRFLPRPDAAVSIVNAIGGVLSGASGGGQTYNLQDHLILGDAEWRVRADLSYASGFGAQADQLVAELDKPNWRYSAGVFWAPGTDLIGRRKMLGLGIETQFDTRLDRDQLQGTPLVVFLEQRARVDVLRDGRVIASAIYEAGNQTLDTSGLPEGSYEVVLRIQEIGGAEREEHRFFTRHQRIAPVGHGLYLLYAGLLVDDQAKAFLSTTATPFIQASAARRLSPHLAIDATVLATNRTAIGEAGAWFITPLVLVRAAGIAGSNGIVGGLLQISSSGNSRFNFDFDLRRVNIGRGARLPESDSAGSPVQSLLGGNPALLPVATASFTQLSGSLSYSLPELQLGVAATYRRDEGQGVSYAIGPTLRWEFLRRGPMHMSFTGDFSFTDRGRSGFAGVTFQLLRGRSSLAGTLGVSSSSLDGDPHRTSPTGNMAGAYQVENVAGGQLDLGAGYAHDLDQDVATANANLRSARFNLSGAIIHAFDDGGSTQYSLGFQTVMALRGGAFALAGRNQTDSMIIVSVKDGEPAERFEVLVNESPVGAVRGGGSLAVPLSSYRRYQVRIRPTGAGLLAYDGSARQVSLYPGTVVRLAWTASPMVAMFGRLVFADGKPIGTATITAPDGIGETDPNGYFQIETAAGAPVQVGLPGGGACRLRLPMVDQAQGYASVGTLKCDPAARNVETSSAIPADRSHGADL